MKTLLLPTWISLFLVIFLSSLGFCAEKTDADVTSPVNYPFGVINPDLLPYGYSGTEELMYSVRWSGGVKIGELSLKVTKIENLPGEYEITANVSTKNGDVHLFYPVKDKFVTKVRGSQLLPYHYELWQKEGYRYRAHKVQTYDQENGIITRIRNGEVSRAWEVDGVVNNEFSSFFNSRLMDIKVGQPFLVPTFADKKREEVAVHPIREEVIQNTVIGDVSTIALMPIMKFKGLYDKRGDTVIWYTNDECRVPVLIKSKIVIGSLVAELMDYKNTACSRYKMIDKKEKGKK